MGKKMKLIPFLFKPTEQLLSSSSSWPWTNCGSPKTLSFRAEKIMNSVFVTTESRLLNSSSVYESSRIIVEDEEYSADQSSIENVIRGVKSSERLFFDNHAGETTSFILGDQQLQKPTNSSSSISSSSSSSSICTTTNNTNDCDTSNNYVHCSSDKVMLLEMDSRDPYKDFKKSMEEMVEANGLNVKEDWEALHKLLSWYLQVNEKSNHGYIVGAFVDLLVCLEYSSASSSFSSPTCSSSSSFVDDDHNNSSSSSAATVITQSPISALSFSSNCSTAPCLLTLFEEEEEEEEEEEDEDEDEALDCR